MKVSTILDQIDSGSVALPEFQRGYVWNRDQVRGLMESLYRRHPVGSLLMWETRSDQAHHRGGGALSAGVVNLLLDGQQRITSLYGIIRGKPPRFFEGNAQAFSGLRFHLEKQEFTFSTPDKMKDDPLSVDVTALMQAGNAGLGAMYAKLHAVPDAAPKVGDYVGHLNGLLAIRDIELHAETVTGADKTIDVVVDIFNRVNSGGTKLSGGDLALAKVCAEWPEARLAMNTALARWRQAGYHFSLDWLLRNVNTVVTGEAKFAKLRDVRAEQVRDGLGRAEKAIDRALNLIAGRLGLDHDRVLFNRFAIPVMSHYIDRRWPLDAIEGDRLLFWFIQSAMWGRFSGSTETLIDKDLGLIADLDGGLDRLIAELRLAHGGLRVAPGHFSGYSLVARFYPVLYMLTRVLEARDFGSGLVLKNALLGKMNQLEVHHIFPKALLYKHKYTKGQVNALANFCFLTKDTNINISAKPPAQYFPEVEAKHPGALASQWIPLDPELWQVESYPAFLDARRRLLAEATNRFLGELGHGIAEPDDAASDGPAVVLEGVDDVPGGVETEDEERALLALNDRVEAAGLPRGAYLYEVVVDGKLLARFDLAWPSGLQEGLSQPVAVLVNEGERTLAVANARGFRYFTTIEAFERYVSGAVLATDGADGSALAVAQERVLTPVVLNAAGEWEFSVTFPCRSNYVYLHELEGSPEWTRTTGMFDGVETVIFRSTHAGHVVGNSGYALPAAAE